MLIGGPLLILFGAVMHRRHRRIVRRARTTSGTVIDAAVYPVQDGCQPVVTYRYHVAGKAHRGTRLTPPPGEEAIIGCYQARRIIATYPRGAEVTVHYQPNEPETAFLRTDSGIIWLIPVVLGLALLWIASRDLIGG